MISATVLMFRAPIFARKLPLDIMHPNSHPKKQGGYASKRNNNRHQQKQQIIGIRKKDMDPVRRGRKKGKEGRREGRKKGSRQGRKERRKERKILNPEGIAAFLAALWLNIFCWITYICFLFLIYIYIYIQT